ncbi:MAG: ATP-grasp domain-containing protein [Candidatus Moranbacteria bacterium]|nr:ATP-grasp domain-containing protein [Candidatus Moranbacteria bacterium]
MLLILKNKKKTGPKMKKFLRLTGAELARKGVDFSVSSLEETEIQIEKNKVGLSICGKPVTSWNNIYIRKVGRNRGVAHMLAHIAKKSGVNLIDRYHEQTKDASDAAKITQMFRLALAGISIPKTYFAGSYPKKHLRNAVTYLKLPIVVKECNSSQGAGVFLAKNISELEKIILERSSQDDRKEIFLQEFIPNDFEYRILVTGSKVAVTEKKIRSEKEAFRNNVHLGATEEFVDISTVGNRIKKEAVLAARTTHIQVAGVDVIERPDGSPVIFEVNSCPALTLDINISPEIKKLAEYLTVCEKK